MPMAATVLPLSPHIRAGRRARSVLRPVVGPGDALLVQHTPEGRPDIGGRDDPADIRPAPHRPRHAAAPARSEEHTSELQSLMRISYAVFCLQKQHQTTTDTK